MLDQEYFFTDFELNNLLYGISFLICSILIGHFLKFLLKIYLNYEATKTRNKVDDFLIAIFEKPVPILVLLGGVYGFKSLAGISDAVGEWIDLGISLGLFYLVTLLAVRVNNVIFKQIITPVVGKSVEKREYKIALDFLKSLINALILIVAAFLVFEMLNYDTGSLLAGIGISGLAIGFAARETLANIISSFVITIMDRNFKVGDRIIVDDKYEGKVVRVGIRATLIKTKDGTNLFIPNSKITSSVLENCGETDFSQDAEVDTNDQ